MRSNAATALGNPTHGGQTAMPKTIPQPLTATEAHRLIRSALLDRADAAHRTAASRHLYGPEHAAQRAAWREVSRKCRALAASLDSVPPGVLAGVLPDVVIPSPWPLPGVTA
jgi:hypothetical protein